MLTAEQIEALSDRAAQLIEPVTEFLISDIAQRIAEAGQLTGTASYEVWQAQQLGISQKQLKKELRKRLKVSGAELEKLLTQAAEVGYNFDISRFPTVEAIPFAQNGSVQQIVNAAVQLAGEELTNITQTIGFVTHDGVLSPLTDAYRKSCDFAFMKVSTGAQDYNSAIREATRYLAEKGIQTIHYESGVRTSLEAAVRRNVMGGLGLMQEKISQQNHDDLGCDGWEISAHAASAPDHEPIQGRQYSDEAFEKLNSSLVRRIGTLNCGHAAFPIILGVNSPQYTPEELEQMRRDNEKGVDYEGKHYTMYEATQRQRQIERGIRKQKRRILVDEKTGDKEKLQNDQIRYQVLNQEYKRFSKAADLRLQHERMEMSGFGPKQAKAAEKEYKELANKANSMYDIGSEAENIAAYYRDLPVRKKIGGEDYPLTLHQGRQNKHIPRTNEYKQYVNNLKEKGQYGPSRLTVDSETAKNLVERYHGTGILIKNDDGKWTNRERITIHPEDIGVTVNNTTGEELKTSVFMIHYSQKGYHIVPDYPDRKGAKQTK